MISEIQTWFVIFIVGVIASALVLVGEVSGTANQLGRIAEAIPFLILGAALFERWLWRWRPLHPHVVSTPVIRGTWKGELQSLWQDAAGQQSAPKTVYLAIDQTLTTVSVRLMSDESASEQIAGTMRRASSGRWRLAAVYVNTPTIDKRAGSPIHHGSLVLSIYGSPVTRLDGEYWTERPSKGRVAFDAFSPVVAESFREAQSLTFK
jgi:hypothetical protein